MDVRQDVMQFVQQHRSHLLLSRGIMRAILLSTTALTGSLAFLVPPPKPGAGSVSPEELAARKNEGRGGW